MVPSFVTWPIRSIDLFSDFAISMSISVIVRIWAVLPGVPSRLSLESTESESMMIISISVTLIVAIISSK